MADVIPIETIKGAWNSVTNEEARHRRVSLDITWDLLPLVGFMTFGAPRLSLYDTKSNALAFVVEITVLPGYPSVPFSAIFKSSIHHPLLHQGYLFPPIPHLTLAEFAAQVHELLLNADWTAALPRTGTTLRRLDELPPYELSPKRPAQVVPEARPSLETRRWRRVKPPLDWRSVRCPTARAPLRGLPTVLLPPSPAALRCRRVDERGAINRSDLALRETTPASSFAQALSDQFLERQEREAREATAPEWKTLENGTIPSKHRVGTKIRNWAACSLDEVLEELERRNVGTEEIRGILTEKSKRRFPPSRSEDQKAHAPARIPSYDAVRQRSLTHGLTETIEYIRSHEISAPSPRPTELSDAASQPTKLSDSASQPNKLSDSASQPNQLSDSASQPTKLSDSASQPTELSDAAPRGDDEHMGNEQA